MHTVSFWTLYVSTPLRQPRRSANVPLSTAVVSLSFSAFSLASANSDPETSLPSLIPLNKRIARLIRTGRVDEARDEFDRMDRRNVVTWNSMLSGYVRLREIAKARKLFDEMPGRDVVSWNLMISGYMSCHRVRDVDEARKLFDLMPKRDSFSWNTMISGYAKNGKMTDAFRLFDRMPDRNIVSWNAVITGFLQNGDSASAVRLFEAMPERESYSYCALVSGLVRHGELDEAERVLFRCQDKDDRICLVNAYNALLAGYGQRGRVEEARRLFDELPFYRGGTKRNIVSWNTMIMSYLKVKDVTSARQLFDQMMDRDTFSWNTMITGYVHDNNMDEAFKLFDKMGNPDTLTWNLMVSGFTQSGNLDFARSLFDEMPQKNIVSWNSIIAGHVKNEDYLGSVGLFIEMQREGVKHDCHTLSSVLSAATGLVDLYLGRQVHQLTLKTVTADVVINNSIITMYSRCGAIREARVIFDETENKDVISWNAMIGGYGSHGFGTEALELFNLMKRVRLKPTNRTFIAVLNACANAGWAEEGRRQFESMSREFGIVPTIEHYASIVYIVGRHGKIEEAVDLVNMMPMSPDKSVWGALLSACRVHNNVKLAQFAAEGLMRVEPGSSAPYVLLYNMYADLELWDDAAKVRLMMEENNVSKERGYSRLDSHRLLE